MALRTTQELYDDLDGTSEKDKPVRRRRFTIDGTQYEADFTDDNHEALKAAVAKYVASARVISRPKKVSAHGVTGSKKQQARIDKAQLDHMRDWCRSHGLQVSDFGRIPIKYEEAYHKAHPVRTAPTAEVPPELNGASSPPFMSAVG